MVFSSLTFLFIFLPLVLAAYYLARPSLRNHILLLASLAFYAWGEPTLLLVMLATIAVNWAGALLLQRSTGHKRLILAATIGLDLLTLGHFKYHNFLIQNLNAIFHGGFDFVDVALPIGISFYTFQAISYLVDVYRGEAEAQRSVYKLALYIALFPQLIAGPIIKYHDICRQIDCRNESFDLFISGVKRFITGLAKKVLIANTLAQVVDNIYAMPYDHLNASAAWIATLAYPFQIYFDFSGYSDMAIGLGLMFGFTFKENFNLPYISKSITEFWRRWHISLSTWFREYLYIPLGGNRKGKRRQIINVAIVFFFTGMWHGASWNFILWGVWHGLFNIMEKLTGWNKDKESHLLTALQHIYTIVVVFLGWILFRAETINQAWKMFTHMFHLSSPAADIYQAGYFINSTAVITLLIAVFFSTDWAKRLLPQRLAGTRLASVAFNACLVALLGLSTMSLVASSYNPFIYFRF